MKKETLKKSVAIAAVAASLGNSLGVNVTDILANEPPKEVQGIKEIQQKEAVQGKFKDAKQVKIVKEAKQVKLKQADQMKDTLSAQSKQVKIK